MILRPPFDVASYLDTNSTSLVLGTNLFVGPIRANSDTVPVESVFVYVSGARPPDRLFNSEPELRYPVVTVAVRSAAYASGSALARSVYQILQSASPSGYLDVVCQQGGPIPNDYNKNDHYVFANDWELSYDSAAAAANFLLPWQTI